MISAILIYGQRGEILASRVYREGLRRAVTDVFRVQVISSAEASSPILTMGSTSFLHIRHNELYVVAVTRAEVDAIAVFEVLYKFCEVCTAQLGHLDESACYRYVAEIYEIFDEIIDYGFAQNADAGVLKLTHAMHDRSDASRLADDSSHGSGSSPAVSLAHPISSLKRTLTSAKSNFSASTSSLGSSSAVSTPNSAKILATQYDNASHDSDVPWRRPDLKHRRNEIFLDVIEHLNAVFKPDGSLLSSSVNGLLRVKAHLSGLPRCEIEMNNVSVLENSQLHACVNHSAFQLSGVVQFVPPEGEFDLLRYRVSQNLRIPLRIINSGEQHGEHTIRLKCNLDPKKHLSNVVITIPLAPSSTSSSQRLKASAGKAKFASGKLAAEWKIARLSGHNEATLRISGDHSLLGHGPILATFSISSYTCSSLRVQSLQVIEDAKYTTLKWVRYLTEAGACEARTT